MKGSPDGVLAGGADRRDARRAPHFTAHHDQRLVEQPARLEIVEKPAQGVIDRRREMPLEIAKRVLMRVPAAQIHLHHAHAQPRPAAARPESRCPIPRGRTDRAPPRAPARGRTGCACRSDRESVPDARRRWMSMLRTDRLTVELPACGRRASRAAVARLASVSELKPVERSQIGQMKLGSRQLLLSHHAPVCLPGTGAGSSRLIVGEAIGARSAAIGRATRRSQINAPPRRSALPSMPGPLPGICWLARGSSTTGGRPNDAPSGSA